MVLEFLKYPFKVGSIDFDEWKNLSKNQNLYEFKVIYPENKITYPEPKTIEEAKPEAFNYRIEEIPEMKVVKLKGGKCFTQNGLVLTCNNKPLNDFTPLKQHPFRNKPYYKFSKPEYIEGNVAVLTNDSCQKNYYHWLIESASRLHLLEKSGYKIDKYIINDECAYQKRVLNLLGISKDRIVSIYPNRLVQADHLVVPSIINYFKEVKTEQRDYYNAKFIPVWALEFYREKLFPLVAETEPKRIYISRKKAPYRTVENEDEIMNFLENKGFKSYFPEELDILEQVELFYNAECVISAHGAGLTNLMFCKPGTKVIEFFDNWYLYQGQQMIAQGMGLDYYYIFANLLDFRFGAGFGCMAVPISKLEKLFNNIKLQDNY